MENNKTVVLNEKQITLPELEERKKQIAKQKGVDLVEVSPDTYRTRIKG